MRGKTVKRLAILIAVVGLIGGTGFFVHAFQIQRLARSVVEQADRAEEKGDLAKAELLLKGHLINLPDDLDVRYKYAKLLLKISKIPARVEQALGIYSGILRRSTGRTDVRKQLMELLFETGDYVRAQNELQILLGPDPLGYDLRLMSSVKDVSGILTAGERLIIVANMDQVLHFRIFDGDGKMVVDTDAKRLTERAQPIEGLRKQLESVWPPHELTQSEKDPVIDAVASIVGYTHPVKKSKDGHLLFLMGRCYQEARDGANAEKYYQAAIEQNAPQRIEAYQRLAILLRDQLGQPKKADELIEEMVKSDPKNYQVYLARGRYRRPSEIQRAGEDFQEALKHSSGEGRIEVQLEIARVAEKQSGLDAARKILEKELETTPDSGALNEALVNLELRAGKVDRAIEILRRILKIYPNSSKHAWLLARIQAQRGDTRELELQIQDLKRIGFSPMLLRFLTAWYNINKNEYAIARDLLVPLQTRPEVTGNPDVKLQVNLLLARCYRHLADPEMEQEIYVQTLKANPGDLTARMRWIAVLLKRGETDQAIEEYQGLVSKEPQVRIPLAQLLIERNRRLPADKRDWIRVDRLIADAAKNAPESVPIRILQANSLLAQGKATEAEKVLDTARSKYPKSVEIWVAQLALLTTQGRVDEAQKLLDQAQAQFGDQVELLLMQAQLSATKMGPQVITLLDQLAQKIDRFSKKEDQHRLLRGLAGEYYRHEDLQAASRLWSRLAEQLPNDLEPQLQLFDLVLTIADKDEADKKLKQNKDPIEKNTERQAADNDKIEQIIQQIERIEGSEGLMGRYCRVSYLVWQAQRARDKTRQEELRTEAHQGINELMARRGDWSLIHLLLARLNEQELPQGQVGLDEKQTQVKLESIINSYLRAVELGHRDPNTVRHVVRLLFAAGRGNEALDLYNRSSIESQPGDDRVERMASEQALKNKDFRRAEEITRKAVTANPGDFEARFRLTQILLASERPAAAETELRQGVELSKNDPVRWVRLVQFLAGTKQPEKAEKAFKEAQSNLAQAAQPKGSLALAECCEFLGRAYEGGSSADAVKKWYGEAKNWFEKARAAKPDDPSIAVRFAQFFLATKQMNEAESHLEAMLKSGSSDKVAVAAASWARRMLALTLIAKGNPEQARKALALFEPTNQPGAASQAAEEPEDQRVLVQVLEAQKTPEHRQRAIEIMSALVGKAPNNFEDRLLLARLYEFAGDWPKAREQYDELITRTENRQDPEALTRRAVSLDQFIKGLLFRHRQASQDRELTKVQELVDKLKKLQPDELNTLILEVAVNRAQSEFENQVALKQAGNPVEKEAALERAQDHLQKATALVQAFANRPNLTLTGLEALAEQAEALNKLDLAEKLRRQIAAKAPAPNGTMGLVAFLGRHDRVKEALDLCEPLWQTIREPELLAVLSVRLVLQPNHNATPAELQRVHDRLTQALKQHPQSTILMVALGNLQERQERYQDAEALYRRAIEQGDRDGVSHNNLAWLLALNGGNLKAALEYVNRAIDLKGPLPDLLDTRGIIYLAAGETQRAITDLEKAVAGDPKPAKYFHLAEAYLKASKVEEAKKNWKLANIPVWEQSGLHPLEKPAYNKIRGELGVP
jgi:cellulose synthase operon protein C